MRIVPFDLEAYNFVALTSAIFSTRDLARLHQERPDLMPLLPIPVAEESGTPFHRTFYEAIRGPFAGPFGDAYRRFIGTWVAAWIDEGFAFQTLPSFRIQLPSDRAIHRPHCDSDAHHRHPPWEINFQIALTRCFDTAALWIESVPGLGDFRPIELEVGQCAIFNGSTCRHYNKVNETGVSRVTLDFRIIPISRYDPQSDVVSLSAGRRFVIGEYYDRFERCSAAAGGSGSRSASGGVRHGAQAAEERADLAPEPV